MVNLLTSPPEETLRAIQEVYEQGRVLDALRLAENFAPLGKWQGVEGCVLAVRIAANTGAVRLATRLAVRAWRADKTHPLAQLQFGLELAGRRGPLALWRALRQWPQCREAAPAVRAEMCALQASSFIGLRDFATAEALLSRAESLDPKGPWVHLQRAHLLEHQDRLEEALSVAEAASALHPHPFHRPSTQLRAHLLQLLDRDEEAIHLLREAGAVLQNGPVMAQLFSLLAENLRWSEAEQALAHYVALCPLAEPPVRKWVAAQQARVAYHLGKRADAARFAAELDDDFYTAFSRKLSAAPEHPERVQLPVTFVRQHFKTCAPATLAALGRFWRMPSEHLKLAEAMCYDGTPHWQQRDWAENNGWFVCEFRVTHETAIELITRQIPFALATVEATYAHMQAVAGFDKTRGTVLLRDPGQPYIVEVPAAEFFQRYRPFGPRGMVFLPIAERARLEGVALPDSELYDEYHQFWLALAKHNRQKAQAALQRMEKLVANHELIWEARLDLATYDANAIEQSKCLDELLRIFPNNPARLLRRLACLRDAPRQERLEFLERVCVAKDADPSLLVELAQVLEADARRHPESKRLLERALRLRPLDSNAIGVLANLGWEAGAWEEATEFYRFAANLEGFREELYRSWFIACRQTRRTHEAMTHLQDRFERFGGRSEQPALTLAWAWCEMEQPGRAREVLVEARRLRPDDGLLLLRAAGLVGGAGENAEADHLLNAAKGRVRENDWLRAAAELAESGLDSTAALKWAREILEREPLALDAHAGAARSLEKLEGHAAALEHLRNACRQFPHHCALQRMLVEWSRASGPAVVESAVRELLLLEPADAWARRELAAALSSLDHDEEALREAVEAARMEPRNSYSFSILGRIHRKLQHLTEAQAQFRRSVELSVDNSDAIHCLLEMARTDSERREELALIERELIQQVVQGDGLLAFLELARPVIESEKLLSMLRQAHAERPDLWHVWAALASQLGHMGQLDEARDVACEATEKFPQLPRVWLDLAMVYQWRNEPEEEIKAAEHAFETNPAWSRSTLALAGALERSGKLDAARVIYERGLRHSAQDAQLHAFYAHLLWRQRQKEAAFSAIERALRLAPAYEWAWGLFMDWANSCGEPDRPLNLCRLLTREGPGEMRTWLVLARLLEDPLTMPERLAASEKALQLDRHSTEAWDLKVELLATAERFDEAIQACEQGTAACLTEAYVLHGRRAWVEARRRQLPEAVRRMRTVLKENANYTWGWTQLAQWLMEQAELAEATKALEQLLRLRPRDPWVHRQLGFIRRKQNDQAGAERDFTTALRLAPTDPYAAQSIFDLQLESGDSNGAAATLRLMEMHQPGARTLASEVLLHLHTQDRSAADKAFERMCAQPDPDPSPLDRAVAGFERADRWPRALKILKRALKQTSCNPQAGVAAIGVLLAHHRPYAATRLFLRLRAGEVQRRSAAPLVNGLAELKRKYLVRFLLWRRGELLAGDDEAWGQVGYALSRFNQMRAAARWLAAWSKRPNVQPWMLFNLCLALRHSGRYEEANRLARQVLEKWGHREGSGDLRLFLAVEAALAGAVPEAVQQLQAVTGRENVAYDQELLALSRALVEFQKAPLGQRRECFKEVQEKLELCFSAWTLERTMKDVRRTFRRAGKVFVREGGGWPARLWFFWKLNWQWLLVVPIAPLALAAAIQPPVLAVILVWLFVRSRR